jgi:hypothetical protein
MPFSASVVWIVAGLSSSTGGSLSPEILDLHFARYGNGFMGGTAGRAQAWAITDGNSSCIHRFFDSSPMSPSGRYLGLTCFSTAAHAQPSPSSFSSSPSSSSSSSSLSSTNSTKMAYNESRLQHQGRPQQQLQRPPNAHTHKKKDSTAMPATTGPVCEVRVVDLWTGQQHVVATTAAWGSQLGAQVVRVFIFTSWMMMTSLFDSLLLLSFLFVCFSIITHCSCSSLCSLDG